MIRAQKLSSAFSQAMRKRIASWPVSEIQNMKNMKIFMKGLRSFTLRIRYVVSGAYQSRPGKGQAPKPDVRSSSISCHDSSHRRLWNHDLIELSRREWNDLNHTILLIVGQDWPIPKSFHNAFILYTWFDAKLGSLPIWSRMTRISHLVGSYDLYSVPLFMSLPLIASNIDIIR